MNYRGTWTLWETQISLDEAGARSGVAMLFAVALADAGTFKHLSRGPTVDYKNPASSHIYVYATLPQRPRFFRISPLNAVFRAVFCRFPDFQIF